MAWGEDAPTPDIVVSERWLASWQSAGAGVRAAVQGAVHDLVRRVRAEPRTAGRRYNTVKGLSVSDVLEIDLTSAWRMVGVYRKGRLHLFDFGNHDLVPRFTEADFRRCKASANPAPRALWPKGSSEPGFFVPADSGGYFEIDDSENREEWLYFLSDEQSVACQAVLLAALRERSAPILLLGGPGTGKTSILVTALVQLVDELGIRPEEIGLAGR